MSCRPEYLELQQHFRAIQDTPSRRQVGGGKNPTTVAETGIDFLVAAAARLQLLSLMMSLALLLR
jgi:hypothetical protein